MIFITEGGVRGGRDQQRLGLGGGLADDGKRLGLSESALDVALAIPYSKWGGVWGGVVAASDSAGGLADLF